MFRYYTELGAQWVELVQLMDKFVPLSRIGIFRNESNPIHPIGPWTHVLVRFIVFGYILIVSLLRETRYKVGWNGGINAQVRGMKSRWNFSQRTHPIHPIGP